MEPHSILLSFPLITNSSRIEFGYETRTGGMSVGSPRLLCRLTIPPEAGGDQYPSDWFPVDNQMSLRELRARFTETGPNYLPDWLLICAYRHAWKTLASKA